MFMEDFLFTAFSMQLALYYSLISFILSVPHIEPFFISEYNTALFTNYFMPGSQNCLKYLWLPEHLAQFHAWKWNSVSIWGFTGFHGQFQARFILRLLVVRGPPISLLALPELFI